MRFPTLTGSNLEGRNIVLPDDLAGDLNIAVVAFQRDQQAQVATWCETLNELSLLPHVATYELKVIQYLPYWRQISHDVGIKRQTGSLRRASSLTLYVNLNDFNRALDIPTVSSIYTFLLDREGNIHWRSQGSCDTARRVSLTKAVRKFATPTLAAVR